MRAKPRLQSATVRTGDVLDTLEETFTSPVTLLRVVPFMGWTTILLDMFAGWGPSGRVWRSRRTLLPVSLRATP